MIKAETNSKDIFIKKMRQEMKQLGNAKELKKKLYEAKEWYTIRAILGNDWANWFVLIGAR